MRREEKERSGGEREKKAEWEEEGKGGREEGKEEGKKEVDDMEERVGEREEKGKGQRERWKKENMAEEEWGGTEKKKLNEYSDNDEKKEERERKRESQKEMRIPRFAQGRSIGSESLLERSWKVINGYFCSIGSAVTFRIFWIMSPEW